MSISLVYAFASMAIFLTATMLFLLSFSLKNKLTYFFTLLAFPLTILFLLMPINEAPIFYYLRSFYIGDLSITSTLFFSAYIIQSSGKKVLYQPAEQKQLILLVVLGGLFLYPLALGLGQLDPYRLGYQPQIMLSILFFLGFYYWYKQYYFLVFVLTSAVLCFNLRLLESNNLWDYVLDSLLLVVFLTIGLVSSLKVRSKRNRNRV